MIDLSTPAQHIAFTSRLSAWLLSAGVADPDARATLAVGLADFLAAAREVEVELEAALTCDVSDPAQADQALTHICTIPAWLFTEARDHANDMEPLWEAHLELPLAAMGTPETDPD